MKNKIVVCGTNHHVAPLNFREKLAFNDSELSEALQVLKSICSEAVLLSTCNRVEIYALLRESQESSIVSDFLALYHDLDPNEVKQNSYHYENLPAILHLFRVVASLDSMVIGESQILSQVNSAYERAFNASSTASIFGKLFPKAISIGKRVRSETDIARGAMSISSSSVGLAKQVFDRLEDKSVVVVGAGEMSELTVKHLVENGVSQIFVANRSCDRAERITEKFNGIPIVYDKDLNFIAEADIVISSTAAPHYVIQPEPFAEVMSKRKNAPMFLIDIAVPRDIDPEIAKIDGVFLYNIDDLTSVVDRNIKDRRSEAEHAEKIVNEEAVRFNRKIRSLCTNATVKGLHQRFEQVTENELKFCLDKANLSESQEEAVRVMTKSIVKKLLHPPVKNLREAFRSNSPDKDSQLQSIQELFELGNR